MTVAAISALEVETLAADDAHLFLWTTNQFLEDAYTVARAWGFKPSTLLTWCKTPMGIGLGGTFTITTEFVLFARRGQLQASERIDTTWFSWKRQKRHSGKPSELQDLVERVSPGPWLELFARSEREGWTPWGNEVTGAV
jgi:N6-adenosine-specific RNA methylase IME4